MRKSRTVLVLGAGASAPYGFPSGHALVTQVVRALEEGGSGIYQTLHACGHAHQLLHGFRDALRLSARASIDAFLESRHEFGEVGKQAIAAALIPYEQSSNLLRDHGVEDWYGYISQFIFGNRSALQACQLGVVTFNYDRSFEHFLFQAAKHSYGLDDAETARSIAHIPVVHVHGRLGAALWEAAPPEGRAFEPSQGHETVVACAKQIRIVHEADAENDPVFRQARRLLRDATRVVFLGFHYHETNVLRLDLPLQDGRCPELTGSAFRLGAGEQHTVKTLLNNKIGLGGSAQGSREFLGTLPLGTW